VLKDRVQLKVFGSKREEIARGCRELHDDELHGLYYSKYYSVDHIKEDKKGGACGT